MQGLAVDEIVVEEGVSGSIPVFERLAGGALFAKLASGDTIISPKLDRLFRSALDALTVVEDMRKRGVSLHLLDLGGDISGNGMSKLFLTIAAAFAEAERDRIRERVSQSKADQKARGRYLGGTLPFGFKRGEGGELVPVDADQEAIREMVALRGQGKALRAIADAMRAKGVKVSHEGVRAALEAQRGALAAPSPPCVNMAPINSRTADQLTAKVVQAA
jgi:putative DNA-invertase from lambdoid prophage Rac